MNPKFKALILLGAASIIVAVVAMAQGPAPVNETGDGTQVGLHPWSGFSGWGVPPVVQQKAGTDPYAALQAFGLIATGTAPEKVGGVTLVTGTQSPIASGLVGTIPELFLLTTPTNAAASSIYVLASGSNNWRVVLTGTGP